MPARDDISSHERRQNLSITTLADSRNDYSSCWSALPNLLRSQVECLMESKLDDMVGRHVVGQMTAAGQPLCRI